MAKLFSFDSHDIFRNEKVISYTDDLEVPLTTWVDETSWPSFEGLALQVYNQSNRFFFII